MSTTINERYRASFATGAGTPMSLGSLWESRPTLSTQATENSTAVSTPGLGLDLPGKFGADNGSDMDLSKSMNKAFDTISKTVSNLLRKFLSFVSS